MFMRATMRAAPLRCRRACWHGLPCGLFGTRCHYSLSSGPIAIQQGGAGSRSAVHEARAEIRECVSAFPPAWIPLGHMRKASSMGGH